MLTLDATGAWQPISGSQIYQRVRSVAEAFTGWGIQKGDRIAILGENRWEWAVTDFATLALGAVDVPIYPTLTPEQIAILLADSGARIAVVSTRAQYEKVAQTRSQTAVERIVLMDEEATADAVIFSSLIRDADARKAARDAEFDRRSCDVRPEDLATLIYTSGTTGEPKGVMLTHGNIACNINYSTNGFGMAETDTCISFLPLSHITARHLDYALYAQNVTIAYCPAFDKLPATMTSVRPTIIVAVPRVYEKVREEVERRAAESPTKNRLFRWAVSTGSKHKDEVAQGRTPGSLGWKIANALVYKKIAHAFGGRVRYFLSGGAPLGLDTAHWYASVGIRILEGYGLTETSPVIAINTPQHNRMGSVGQPLPNVSCRIAEDGELLVSGPSIFRGYWKQPPRSPDYFEGEGFFRTGDIAHLDSE
ncbi:MAG: AMP-binding protein, partial [Acidobacteriaceae bacterium]|nr:AMP-binding protein [Acidobacteriaceae bacterium]